MDLNAKILVLGSSGMVGSSLVRALSKQGFKNILQPRRTELNLLSQESTLKYFNHHEPQYVFDAAAKVGGIIANNTYRADFIFQNLQIQNHLFEAAFRFNVKKLLFLGSSCIYPKDAPQPIQEEYLLTGPLEPTNEPYGIAKIAGVKLAENFRRQYGKCFFSAMPTNLYGPNDNYHPENSHVIPGLIARMHQAKLDGEKVFKVWGSGRPKREFLFVDDLAQACLMLMNLPDDRTPDLINIGSGEDLTIQNLAEMIKSVVGFKGQIEFDSSKPDGMMRKVMDVSRIKNLGWRTTTPLDEGLKISYQDFLKKHESKN
jgi:GDP-L-fucose synthase